MEDIVFDTEMIIETEEGVPSKIESVSFDGDNYLYTEGGKSSSICIS